MVRTCGTTEEYFRRMLKKAVQQGRSERRGEEVHTALRVGRSPLVWILANGKAPTAFPTSEKLLLKVEPLSDARTKFGERRVLARRGREGEKSDFFSILLGTGRRRQTHFDARVVLIDVFVEVGFDDAVVVDAESLTEGILRDLEPAIDVSS